MTKKKVIVFAVAALLATNLLYAQSNIGIDYYRLGDYVRAKEYLTKNIASNPAENNYYLGEIAFAENNPTLAAEFYNKGLSADPANVLNQVGLLKIKLKSDTQAADKELTDLSKKYKKEVDILIAVTRAYLDNSMLAQANKMFENARKAGSKHPDVYILEGDIIATSNPDVKKLGDVAAKYESATHFAPENPLGYVKTAQIYEKINSQLAIEKLKTILEKKPDYLPALGLIGKVYTSNGFYPQAIETYKKLGESNMGVEDMERYARAEYFIEPESKNPKDKDYTAAKKIVETGLKMSPDHFVLNRYLMYIDSKTNKTDEGLAVADKFFKYRVDTGYIAQDFTNYGLLLTQAKRYNEAYIAFDKAINLNPSELNLYEEAASAARAAKNYMIAAHYAQQEIAQKRNDADDPDDYTDDLIDVTMLGNDYYTAGATLPKNLPFAEELKNNPAYVENAKKVPGVVADSLNDIAYFAKYLGRFYLIKADSVFEVQVKMAPESYTGYRYKALVNSALNPDYTVGTAKPYYEKVIEILTKPDNELTNNTKRVLIEAYQYIGYHYYMTDDKANSIAYMTKILELDPAHNTAKAILDDLNKK